MSALYTVMICDDSETERQRFYERQFENFNIYGVTKRGGRFIERIKLDTPQALYKEISLLKSRNELPDLVVLDLFYRKKLDHPVDEERIIAKIIKLKEQFRDIRSGVLSYLAPTGLDLLKRIRNIDKITRAELPILVYTDKNFNFLSPDDFNDLYELDPGFAYKDRDDPELRSTIPVLSEYLRILSAIERARSEKLKRSVFITHGRKPDWEAIDQALNDTMGVMTVECAREASRGRTIIQKISELSWKCGFAIVVMTAEDQMDSGEIHARENVIHEIGYFQGAYGLDRVCILHEEGVHVPTNLSGIVYISYSSGRIEETFAMISRELTAAGIIGT